jgi:hypothetical protein
MNRLLIKLIEIIRGICESIVDILRIHYSVLAVLGLMEILRDKEIIACDGTQIGSFVDIESDLQRGEIWVMAEKNGQSFPLFVK